MVQKKKIMQIVLQLAQRHMPRILQLNMLKKKKIQNVVVAIHANVTHHANVAANQLTFVVHKLPVES